jgi:FKBP-type peptidyl-prolyl cis-trans isomerase
MFRAFSRAALLLFVVGLALPCAPALAGGATPHQDQAKTPAPILMSSGIRVTFERAGEGVSPRANSTVRVNYTGALTNGKVFDQAQGVTFSLSQVVACWRIALQQMKVGAKARVFCPSHTAYGERGASNIIPPGADLVFEIELLAAN